MKYLGINNKNTGKTQSQKTKKHYEEIKTSKTMTIMPWPWIQRCDMLKMAVLPKLIYRLNTIPIKIPADLHVDEDK